MHNDDGALANHSRHRFKEHLARLSKGVQNIFASSPVSSDLSDSSQRNQYVGDSFEFIATGITPLPEAVHFSSWSVAQLCHSSSGGDKPEYGEKTICFGHDEG
jgi:hypothetical protein